MTPCSEEFIELELPAFTSRVWTKYIHGFTGKVFKSETHGVLLELLPGRDGQDVITNSGGAQLSVGSPLPEVLREEINQCGRTWVFLALDLTADMPYVTFR